MIIPAKEEHNPLVLAFLQREAVYNTFLISDIQSYGYDKDFQQIYLSTSEDGTCEGVYLRYYNNLIVSGGRAEQDASFLAGLAGGKVDTVMGKAVAVKAVARALTVPHSYICKRLLHLPHEKRLFPQPAPVGIRAKLADVDRVHNFLMSIPEFRQMYAEKDMIVNRIKNREGVHIFLEREGEIVAHANSAAHTEKSCVIGGVAVAVPYRGQGLAKAMVSALCRTLLAEGRTPCLFSEVPPERSLFTFVGFEKMGEWGVVTLTRA